MTCANATKNISEHDDGKTKQTNVPKKKKARAKKNKEFLQENVSNQNGEDSESDAGIATAERNKKDSNSNSCSASSRKKFSKTAKLVGQGDQGEDFGDVNASEENEGRLIPENKDKTKLGTVNKGQNLKPIKGGSGKNQVNQEKLAGQEKRVIQENAVSREKLDCQVNGYEEEGKKLSHHEGKCGNENRKGKQNGGKTRSEGSEEEDYNETCTEEEERQCEEKENRAVKKQRTKLVKKVKVRVTAVKFLLQNQCAPVVNTDDDCILLSVCGQCGS